MSFLHYYLPQHLYLIYIMVPCEICENVVSSRPRRGVSSRGGLEMLRHTLRLGGWSLEHATTCHICVINISDIILPTIYIYCSVEGKGKGMATN